MLATRRENVSSVPGYKVYRQRTRLLLTPRAVKAQMVKERRVKLTQFDKMLTAQEADALERWATNEQLLCGRASTQNWLGTSTKYVGEKRFSPIDDSRMMSVNLHCEFKKHLDGDLLQLLDAFTAIQNRREGALSPAQYGLIFCPDAKHKSEAFLKVIRDAARLLATRRY